MRLFSLQNVLRNLARVRIRLQVRVWIGVRVRLKVGLGLSHKSADSACTISKLH